MVLSMISGEIASGFIITEFLTNSLSLKYYFLKFSDIYLVKMSHNGISEEFGILRYWSI